MFTLDWETMMPELIAALGELALASRLRRLSELLMQDVSRVYHEQGLEFEPRWFLLFYELDRSGALAATELADRIGLADAAVDRIADELVRHGLLKSSGERRRRVLDVAPKGREMLGRLRPLWQDIREATAGFVAEASPNLLAEIDSCEEAIRRRTMYRRVNDRIKRRQLSEVEVVPYRRRYREAFRRLNVEWLERSFAVEPADREILDHPEKQVIKKGGAILFARVDGKVVGTCALVRLDWRRLELVKMAVDPAFRGRQVGRKLALAAIERARRLRARELIARSSPKLEAANRLYGSLGFECVGADQSGRYQRRTILHRLELKPDRGARGARAKLQPRPVRRSS